MTLDFLKEFDFFAGVPDSQLKPLCDYLMDTYGISKDHIIAANEGNCVALAAGYHLATGKVPVVYMQNSGIGNIINPVASLMNERIYGFPCVFIVGWRGEPGIHDEPQHIFQGAVTLKLLEDMDIRTYVIGKETTPQELSNALDEFRPLLAASKQVAFVVRKGALTFDKKVKYQNAHAMLREEIVRHIVNAAGRDLVVSTTGKASRELFEVREANGQGHELDFLTVGSMGHSSSIALGLALQRPQKKIWCIDGDGAALMHMGAMAVIGAHAPTNFIHILINNGAHETVGGMPTVADKVDWVKIAEGCGYLSAKRASDFATLDALLDEAARQNKLSFIEAKCALGSRENLGRPTATAIQNKMDFMRYIRGVNA